MVFARAFVGVGMEPGSDSYLPPTTEALQAAVYTPTQVDILDPLGRLQSYFGSFDLLALLQEDYSTSTFTGYKQYSGAAANEADLQYEVSGASVNGQVLFDLIDANDLPGVLAELFKGADSIIGSGEDDLLIAFSGDDTIKGGDGNDALFGDLGNDLISGNQGADSIFGGVQDDFLRGGKDGDRLFGEADNDRLNGNLGNDTLSGGLGADIFMLSKDFDVILDFNALQGDTIEILESSGPYQLASTGPEGSGDLQIIRAVGTTTFLGVALASFDEASSIVLI